jgi:hypothetical protein
MFATPRLSGGRTAGRKDGKGGITGMLAGRRRRQQRAFSFMAVWRGGLGAYPVVAEGAYETPGTRVHYNTARHRRVRIAYLPFVLYHTISPVYVDLPDPLSLLAALVDKRLFWRRTAAPRQRRPCMGRLATGALNRPAWLPYGGNRFMAQNGVCRC